MNTTHTIPHDVIEDMAALAASTLDIDIGVVNEAVDSVAGHAAFDVILAVTELGTCEAATLAAHLDGESILDDSLDEWLEVG